MDLLRWWGRGKCADDRPSALKSGWSPGPALGQELNSFAVKLWTIVLSSWIYLMLCAVHLRLKPCF